MPTLRASYVKQYKITLLSQPKTKPNQSEWWRLTKLEKNTARRSMPQSHSISNLSIYKVYIYIYIYMHCWWFLTKKRQLYSSACMVSWVLNGCSYPSINLYDARCASKSSSADRWNFLYPLPTPEQISGIPHRPGSQVWCQIDQKRNQWWWWWCGLNHWCHRTPLPAPFPLSVCLLSYFLFVSLFLESFLSLYILKIPEKFKTWNAVDPDNSVLTTKFPSQSPF